MPVPPFSSFSGTVPGPHCWGYWSWVRAVVGVWGWWVPGCGRRPLGPGQDTAPAPPCVLHPPCSAAKWRLCFWMTVNCFEDDSWEEMHKQ